MSAHEETGHLIPWYVNGTLNEQDMARVQEHLETCAACRATMNEEVQHARRLHRSEDDPRTEAVIADQDAHLAALRANLQSNRPRPARTSRLVPTMAALVVLALPLAFVTTTFDTTTERTFEAQTGPAAESRPVLQLVFAPDTSARDIDLVLLASGELIGTPSPRGVYRVALATDEPERLLARLRDHPAIRWAELEL